MWSGNDGIDVVVRIAIVARRLAGKRRCHFVRAICGNSGNVRVTQDEEVFVLQCLDDLDLTFADLPEAVVR